MLKSIFVVVLCLSQTGLALASGEGGSGNEEKEKLFSTLKSRLTEYDSLMKDLNQTLCKDCKPGDPSSCPTTCPDRAKRLCPKDQVLAKLRENQERPASSDLCKMVFSEEVQSEVALKKRLAHLFVRRQFNAFASYDEREAPRDSEDRVIYPDRWCAHYRDSFKDILNGKPVKFAGMKDLYSMCEMCAPEFRNLIDEKLVDPLLSELAEPKVSEIAPPIPASEQVATLKKLITRNGNATLIVGPEKTVYEAHSFYDSPKQGGTFFCLYSPPSLESTTVFDADNGVCLPRLFLSSDGTRSLLHEVASPLSGGPAVFGPPGSYTESIPLESRLPRQYLQALRGLSPPESLVYTRYLGPSSLQIAALFDQRLAALQSMSSHLDCLQETGCAPRSPDTGFENIPTRWREAVQAASVPSTEEIELMGEQAERVRRLFQLKEEIDRVQTEITSTGYGGLRVLTPYELFLKWETDRSYLRAPEADRFVDPMTKPKSDHGPMWDSHYTLVVQLWLSDHPGQTEADLDALPFTQRLSELSPYLPIFGVTYSSSSLKVQLAYQDVMYAPSVKVRNQTLETLKNELNSKQKLALGASLGSAFLSGYDHDRANAGISATGVVTTSELFDAFVNGRKAGVCRDIATALAEILGRMGVPSTVAAFTTFSTFHATVFAPDPEDPSTVLQLNYNEVNSLPQASGVGSLSQLNSNPSMGILFYLFNSDGKPIAVQPSELGFLAHIASDGQPRDFAGMHRIPEVVKIRVGNNLRIAIGRNVSGGTMSTIAWVEQTEELKQGFQFKGSLAWIAEDQYGRVFRTSLAGLYNELQLKYRQPIVTEKGIQMSAYALVRTTLLLGDGRGTPRTEYAAIGYKSVRGLILDGGAEAIYGVELQGELDEHTRYEARAEERIYGTPLDVRDTPVGPAAGHSVFEGAISRRFSPNLTAAIRGFVEYSGLGTDWGAAVDVEVDKFRCTLGCRYGSEFPTASKKLRLFASMIADLDPIELYMRCEEQDGDWYFGFGCNGRF